MYNRMIAYIRELEDALCTEELARREYAAYGDKPVYRSLRKYADQMRQPLIAHRFDSWLESAVSEEEKVA